MYSALVQSLSPVQVFANALSYETIFYFIFSKFFFFLFPIQFAFKSKEA